MHFRREVGWAVGRIERPLPVYLRQSLEVAVRTIGASLGLAANTVMDIGSTAQN